MKIRGFIILILLPCFLIFQNLKAQHAVAKEKKVARTEIKEKKPFTRTGNGATDPNESFSDEVGPKFDTSYKNEKLGVEERAQKVTAALNEYLMLTETQKAAITAINEDIATQLDEYRRTVTDINWLNYHRKELERYRDKLMLKELDQKQIDWFNSYKFKSTVFNDIPFYDL